MTVNYYHCNSLGINGLFTDAEAGEDGGEDLGGGDVAGDGGEVVDGGSERLGDEVGGEVGVNGLDYFLG